MFHQSNRSNAKNKHHLQHVDLIDVTHWPTIVIPMPNQSQLHQTHRGILPESEKCHRQKQPKERQPNLSPLVGILKNQLLRPKYCRYKLYRLSTTNSF